MQRDPFEDHNFSIKLGEQVFYPNRDHKELKHISVKYHNSLLDHEVVELGKIMAAGKFRNLQGLYCVSCVSHTWQICVRLLQKLCILSFSVNRSAFKYSRIIMCRAEIPTHWLQARGKRHGSVCAGRGTQNEHKLTEA
jgi:hypothetical protein